MTSSGVARKLYLVSSVICFFSYKTRVFPSKTITKNLDLSSLGLLRKGKTHSKLSED